MKSVEDTRLQNLETLVSIAGTAEALADKADLSPVYISQIRSRAIDLKTGKPRNLGARAARKLEVGMALPTGWMDVDHSDMPPTEPPAAGWPFGIDYKRYERLSTEQKARIESVIEGMILAWEGEGLTKSKTAA